MMRLAVIVLLSGFISCSLLPKIYPVAPDEKKSIEGSCTAHYIRTPVRMIHRIDATMKGGHQTTVIGVTVASPGRGSIHSVMMTLEGLVVLDVQDGMHLKVNRSVPPFDSFHLVMGMVEDIRLIIFRPEGQLAGHGRTAAGESICRYRTGETVTDVIAGKDDCTVIVYKGASPVKKVRFYGFNREGVPERIELKSLGPYGYRLDLTLMEIEGVSE